MDERTQQLFNYRIDIMRKALDHQKTDRVPIWANMMSWMFIDAGISALQASRDFDKAEAAARRFVEKYPVDGLNMCAGYIVLPTTIYDALGASDVWAAGGGDENNINGIQEAEMIKADEYDELKENYTKAMWEKAMPRVFPEMRNFSMEQMVNAVKVAKEYNDARVKSIITLREEYGLGEAIVGSLTPTGVIPAGSGFINQLLNMYRGIKGLALDLRRQPDKVAEVCEFFDTATIKRVTEPIYATERMSTTQPYDANTSFMAHIILNNKQFGQFFMPVFDAMARACEDTGKQLFVNAEADFLRFADYLGEYKKGTVSCIVEMDNPYEVRKKLPNIGIIGGLSVDTMGNSTPEKCVDMAKKAIDELGANGGLWLAPNKFVTYAYDMKSENLSAVCDFALNYKS